MSFIEIIHGVLFFLSFLFLVGQFVEQDRAHSFILSFSDFSIQRS